MSGRVLLGLDSCGAETTLALGAIDGDAVRIVRESRLAARTAGSLLTGALEALLAGTPPSELRALVVVRGPGSFTGIRVGLGAAKGLAEAAAIPVIALSRLAVLAQTAAADYGALYAARGHVYLREVATGAEQLLPAGEASGLLAGRTTIACEERALALLPFAVLVPAPTAADALRLAPARVLAGDWEDTGALDGLYLWRAEQMLRAAP